MRPDFAIPQWLVCRIAIDRRALTAFRMSLGVCLLTDIGLRCRDLVAFYTDAGALPRSTLHGLYPSVGGVSLLTVSGTVWAPLVIFGLTALAGLALVVGYRPCLSAGVAFVLLVSIHLRNPVILNAGDTLFRRLLYWSLLVPMGSNWAIGSLESRSEQVATVGTAGVLLQVLAVYVTNGMLKLRDSYWHQGTAVQYVFQLDHLTVAAGDVIAGWQPVLLVADWVWLAMLFASPLLIILTGWYRTGLVAVFIAAHLGMALSLRLGVFPLVSILGLLLFFPSPFWDALGEALPTWTALTVPSWSQLSIQRDSARLPTVTNSVATFSIVTIIVVNAIAMGFVAAPAGTPDRIEDRSWNMFAPSPPLETWWYAAPATLVSGAKIDAFTQEPVNLSRPPDVSDRFPTHRWKKFLGTVRHEPRLRQSLAAYLCTRWNRNHDDPIERVDLIILTEQTKLNGSESVERERLGSYQCD
ncbi:MAG: HTTM domain-containing protein [Haloarcula sp.]